LVNNNRKDELSGEIFVNNSEKQGGFACFSDATMVYSIPAEGVGKHINE
jgi:hypothetical protein